MSIQKNFKADNNVAVMGGNLRRNEMEKRVKKTLLGWFEMPNEMYGFFSNTHNFIADGKKKK